MGKLLRTWRLDNRAGIVIAYMSGQVWKQAGERGRGSRRRRIGGENAQKTEKRY